MAWTRSLGMMGRAVYVRGVGHSAPEIGLTDSMRLVWGARTKRAQTRARRVYNREVRAWLLRIGKENRRTLRLAEFMPAECLL